MLSTPWLLPPLPWQFRCSCLAALHRDASDTIHCPEKYRRLFEAVSTNYPAAAFLHPLYADSQFEHVLQQQQHIGHVEAADMHHGFPLLHAIVQQCSWDVIPSDWLPFLKHLAKQASAAGRASAVSLGDLSLSPVAVCCHVGMYVSHTKLPTCHIAIHFAACAMLSVLTKTLSCRSLSMLLMTVMRICIVSCLPSPCVAACRHSKQTGVR